MLIANLSFEPDIDAAALLPSLGPVTGLAMLANQAITQQEYLSQYGHRGPHEFDISIPRPAENPDWLDQELLRFQSHPVDVQNLLAQQKDNFETAWGRFQSCHPHQVRSTERNLRESARRARLREQTRSEYVRDRWMARLLAMHADKLTSLNEDVFFLTLKELLDWPNSSEVAMRSIPLRKLFYQRCLSLPSYSSIIRGAFDPFHWASDSSRRSDIFIPPQYTNPPLSGGEKPNLITGSSGSAGQVEGLARVILDPTAGDQLQKGEILVAIQTDISWTLLFPRAAAVVTDVGAPLSHAAIVARELGIPAVVGCGDATSRLKTGDRVRVDGARGSVEILSH